MVVVSWAAGDWRSSWRLESCGCCLAYASTSVGGGGGLGWVLLDGLEMWPWGASGGHWYSWTLQIAWMSWFYLCLPPGFCRALLQLLTLIIKYICHKDTGILTLTHSLPLTHTHYRNIVDLCISVFFCVLYICFVLLFLSLTGAAIGNTLCIPICGIHDCFCNCIIGSIPISSGHRWREELNCQLIPTRWWVGSGGG